MYRDCIALAITFELWATMETASGPGVRGTSFMAIPQSIKIINQSYDFLRSYRIPNWPYMWFSITGGNGRYRDYIIFAVYSNSLATMDIMLPSPGLEKPSSGLSHNLLNKYLKKIPPTFLFHISYYYVSYVCSFLLFHPCCSHARGILCGIHTSCMGSPLSVVHAKWCLAFLSFATKDCFKSHI